MLNAYSLNSLFSDYNHKKKSRNNLLQLLEILLKSYNYSFKIYSFSYKLNEANLLLKRNCGSEKNRFYIVTCEKFMHVRLVYV